LGKGFLGREKSKGPFRERRGSAGQRASKKKVRLNEAKRRKKETCARKKTTEKNGAKDRALGNWKKLREFGRLKGRKKEQCERSRLWKNATRAN